MPKSYSTPRYHAQNQIIRAIRNVLAVTLIPLYNAVPWYKNAQCTKNRFILWITLRYYLHIYILVLDILGIFTNVYFGDRTGLSLKLLLEALCSTSSRHRYRKTNTDIQRSIFSLPRFPLSFPSCVASFLLRQRKWNPVRDAIRATFVPLLDQRYFVLHLESTLRPSNTSSAFESVDTFASYLPPADTSYENRVRFEQSAKK